MKGKLDFSELGLSFTPKQTRYVTSLTQNIALIGGFGSGKTLPFCVKALYMSLLNKGNYSGLLVSPTHEMFARTLLPTLRDDIMTKLTITEDGASLWDLSHYSPSRKSLILPWGFTYYFGSADVPLRTRGMNLAVVGVDEATLIRDFPQLAISLSSRLRRARPREDGNGTYSQFFMDGTPEGLDSVYEMFCIPPDGKTEAEVERKTREWRETHELIRIATIDNPGASQEFINQLKLTLTDRQIESYIYGKHVDVSGGRAYYNFNENDNVRREAQYDPDLPLHISWDFGKNPMTCTVHQIRAKKLLFTIDEISLLNSNTPEVCAEFIRRYGIQGLKHRNDIYIYGDASAVVGTSQFDEIEDWIRPAFAGNVHRRVPRKNPKHSSRLKAANGLLKNARGEIRWIIHPGCRTLIRDLKLQQMDEKNKLSKDKKQMTADGTTLGHSSDTADYIIDWCFPYRRTPGRTTSEKTGMLDWMSH